MGVKKVDPIYSLEQGSTPSGQPHNENEVLLQPHLGGLGSEHDRVHYAKFPNNQ